MENPEGALPKLYPLGVSCRSWRPLRTVSIGGSEAPSRALQVRAVRPKPFHPVTRRGAHALGPAPVSSRPAPSGRSPGASVCLPAAPRHRCEAAPSGGGRSLLPPKPGAAATQSVSGCPATLSADHRTVPSGPKPFRELPGRPCGYPENPSRICRSRPVRGPSSGPKARRGSGKVGRRRDPVNRDFWLDFARNRRDFATVRAGPELHRCGFCRCRSV
jgi:hypothetical protein